MSDMAYFLCFVINIFYPMQLFLVKELLRNFISLSSHSSAQWSTNWGHCKLKLTMKANQVKCWFLRGGRGNQSTQRKPLGAE